MAMSCSKSEPQLSSDFESGSEETV